jgi:sulfate transport system substrate-binding protein
MNAPPAAFTNRLAIEAPSGKAVLRAYYPTPVTGIAQNPRNVIKFPPPSGVEIVEQPATNPGPKQPNKEANMKIDRSLRAILILCLFFSTASSPLSAEAKKEATLLNVSYDPTRELYQDFNHAFVKYWKDQTGETVTVNQSHGGSGKQARSVIDGLEADVVTLALAYDIDSIVSHSDLIAKDWQSRFPNQSTPYTSTIVFLVRHGNPKNIKDWGDLIRPDIATVTPNPKTSGGARWNYLAAWGWAMRQYGNDETRVKDFMKQLFSHVPVLDTGARGSTTTFVERGIGDVLLAWENEALLIEQEIGHGQYDIVRPSLSILAEPPVSLVDKNVQKHGTEKTAKAYLEYLYSEEGQTIAARHFYRPRNPLIAGKFKERFPAMELLTIDRDFGGWDKAQDKHFRDGGFFDDIYQPG